MNGYGLIVPNFSNNSRRKLTPIQPKNSCGYQQVSVDINKYITVIEEKEIVSERIPGKNGYESIPSDEKEFELAEIQNNKPITPLKKNVKKLNILDRIVNSLCGLSEQEKKKEELSNHDKKYKC